MYEMYDVYSLFIIEWNIIMKILCLFGNVDL